MDSAARSVQAAEQTAAPQDLGGHIQGVFERRGTSVLRSIPNRLGAIQ